MDMAKTVVGLFESFGQAQNAVRDLAVAGIDRVRIGAVSTPAGASRGSPKDEVKESKVATLAAGAGAAAIGGLSLGMALGPLAIPGVGLVVAAGALASGLAGAGLAASLPKVLRKLGVPERESHAYAEGVRRGGTLVSVEGLQDREVELAVDIMKKHGAVDIQKRAEEWRQAGWSGPAQDTGEALFIFEYEEVEAYPGEERRRSRQPYTGAERRKAA
jgi:hypothetical protein